MPTTKAITETINRARKVHHNQPPCPENLADLGDIPESYATYQKNTISGKCDDDFFLGRCHAPGAERFPTFIFGSRKSLRYLATHSEWGFDGTFGIRPLNSAQVFIIHVRWGRRKTIPVIYAVMTRRQTEDYIALFEFLNTIVDSLDENGPESIMSDFECASSSAANEVWGNQIVFCCFHLAQSQRRQIDESGLRPLVDKDLAISKQVLKLRAIIFVHEKDVPTVWDRLAANTDERLQPIVTWFERNYVGKRLRNNRRSTVRYSIDKWNMHSRKIDDCPRTNNSVEGQNNALKKKFTRLRPNFWTFIVNLKKFQEDVDFKIIDFLRNPDLADATSANTSLEFERQRLCKNYEKFDDKLDFIEAIASKMRFFINNLVSNNIMDTLFEPIDELNPTDDEIMLIRAIIVLNSDIEGLNTEFKNSLSNMRDELHNALYQSCQNDQTNAPSRFAKFLHLLSKTTILARDLIEHIKLSHSFNTGRKQNDPIFYELFGDLFHDEIVQTQSKANDYLIKSSPSPWSVGIELS
uniref:NR LBD domain-containing protein n=1 Tax=Panagrolaimus sp. JU765 TaxID=591449 RepID=A0AC34R916_9BILA